MDPSGSATTISILGFFSFKNFNDNKGLKRTGKAGIFSGSLELAKEGSKIAICSRSKDKLKIAKEEIVKETGATVEIFEADLSVHKEIKNLFLEVKEKLGDIEVLVNNVGGPPPGTFETLEDQDWLKAINLTMMSALRMTYLVLPKMKGKLDGTAIRVPTSNVSLIDLTFISEN